MSRRKAVAIPAPEPVDLEVVDPASLVPWEANPRDNAAAVAPVAASIRRFGFGSPIVARRSDRRVLAGHTRLLAARQLGLEGVPVRWLELTDGEAAAFALADNRLGELAEWDDARLAEVLKALDRNGVSLEEIGFDDRQLVTFLARTGDEAQGQTGADEIPEPPARPRSEPGTLWLLGDHRLLCGDATDPADVARVIGSVSVDACISDPPYGMNWDADSTRFSGGKRKFTEGRKRKNVVGDDRPFDPTPLLAHRVVVLWGLNHFCGRLTSGGALVWIKQPDDLFGSFLSDCEIAWTNVGCGVYAIRHVWRGVMRESERGEFHHPVQKPVAVVAWTMERVKAGEVIFDPYVGSGTTIIAAEQTGRRCYALEIDPQYVDVAVARWEAFTGKRAEKA